MVSELFVESVEQVGGDAPELVDEEKRKSA